MKIHRVVMNGIVAGLFVGQLENFSGAVQIVVLVFLCIFLSALGRYQDENS